MAGAKAMSYRKLFDGRAATPSMTSEELLSLCARIRSYHEQGMMGALALVGTAEQTMVFARLLGVGVGQAADQAVRHPPAGAKLDRRPRQGT